MDLLKKETFSESLEKMDSDTLYARHVCWSIRQKELIDERVKLNEAIHTIEQIKHAYMDELFKRDMPPLI
nr:MAG: hypothetical protein [Microvirus sp.]